MPKHSQLQISKSTPNKPFNTSAQSSQHLSTKSLSSAEAALEVARIAIEQKGLDVRAVDVSKCSSITDHFVIISATSERHAKGIADKVINALRDKGEKSISTDGYEQGEWILIDYSDLIVHIFFEPSRQYYAFDDLWKEGQELDLGSELSEQARKLRTGVIGTAY